MNQYPGVLAWDPARKCTAVLEGCHRVAAAKLLGIKYGYFRKLSKDAPQIAVDCIASMNDSNAKTVPMTEGDELQRLQRYLANFDIEAAQYAKTLFKIENPNPPAENPNTILPVLGSILKWGPKLSGYVWSKIPSWMTKPPSADSGELKNHLRRVEEWVKFNYVKARSGALSEEQQRDFFAPACLHISVFQALLENQHLLSKRLTLALRKLRDKDISAQQEFANTIREVGKSVKQEDAKKKTNWLEISQRLCYRSDLRDLAKTKIVRHAAHR